MHPVPYISSLVSIVVAVVGFWPALAAAQYMPAQYGATQTQPPQALYPQVQYPQVQPTQAQYSQVQPQQPQPWQAQIGQAQPWQAQTLPPTEAAIAPCEIEPSEDARIVARVGGEVVLASEVMSLFVRDFLDKLDEPIPHEQREELIRGRLKYHTELKLIYLDAKRTIPAEAMPKVKESIAKHFEDKEVENMMKIAKVDSRQALEDKLHKFGTSIGRQKHMFIERALAMQWMQQQSTAGTTITHEMLLDYYNQHLTDYDHIARARWEELAVRVSSQANKAEAFAQIARMGNLVQDGASFSEVAKNGSDGITADKGGVRDWTTKGSLVSEEIDKAIFSLPIGALSPIIESKRGFHIVRVIEREDAYRTPFFEVQGEIRKKLKNQQDMQGRKEYLAKLSQEAKVWTIFDKPSKEQLQADRRGKP